MLVQSCVRFACNIFIWCDLFFFSGSEGAWKNHEAGSEEIMVAIAEHAEKQTRRTRVDIKSAH